MVLSGLARFWLALPALLLSLAVACGTAAEPTAPPPTAPQAVATPTPATGDTPAPTPVAQPTVAQPPAPAPSGTLNVGLSDLGPFLFHPTTAGNPQIYIISTTMGEGLMHLNKDGVMAPMLAESWSVSEDFLTWTFNIRPGVQLHKGYGEMTAEDVAYSLSEGWSNSAVHARATFIDEFFNHPDGGTTVTDRYTMVVNTGVPWVSVRAYEFLRHEGGTAANIVSKRQSEEMGSEAASRDIALTGSWELAAHRTGEFWRMQAVADHWRKTPHFAELVLWEIPEESARLAGFQTGNLDTFSMSFDSIPLVESVSGAQLMSGGAIGNMGLNFYGQMYLGVGTPEQHHAFDPDRAWVSANPDVNSVEWANARNVRLAMSIAIDRQTIVDTLLHGFGKPLAVRDWAGFESRMPDHWHWEFDPDRPANCWPRPATPTASALIW